MPVHLCFAESRSDKSKKLFRHYTVGSYDSFEAPRFSTFALPPRNALGLTDEAPLNRPSESSLAHGRHDKELGGSEAPSVSAQQRSEERCGTRRAAKASLTTVGGAALDFPSDWTQVGCVPSLLVWSF
ncbi:hypothetical protein Z043_119521 [Scleropages formosus]|uniref:Uncharacterized protein n=1 Tax=Scleropages formosus TaxID=113540 RepID=A0A0P7UKV0_SCLFO|nr:hypothetical protein Z043_119521 [Scleropages formosus]